MRNAIDGIRGHNGLPFVNGFSGTWGDAGHILMIIAGMILFALLVFCTVVSIKYLVSTRKAKKHTTEKSAAVTILNERYARGEIKEEEYQKKKDDINK